MSRVPRGPRAAGGLRGAAAGVLSAACLGSTIVLQRAVATGGPGAVASLTVRFALAGALLVGLQRLRGLPILPPAGERAWMAVFGLGCYSVESACFFLALERGTAAAVALLFYTYPAVVAAVEVGLGTLPLTGRILGAVGLAVGGGAVVAVGAGSVAISATGIAFVVVAVVCFSTYVLGTARLLRATSPVQAATWTALGAATGVGLFGAATGGWQRPDTSAGLLLGMNGAVTAAAFGLFFVALGHLGPARTAVVTALEAVFAVLGAAVFLGEGIGLGVALGGAAVVTGAMLAAGAVPPGERVRELTPP